MKSRSNMIAAKGKDHSRELIKKFFEGSYPADTERRFHLWLLSEKKWEEKDTALEEMWEMVPYGNPREAIGSLNAVRTKLGMPRETVKLGHRRLSLKVAAVVIPVLLIAGAGFFFVDRLVNTDSGQQVAATFEAVAGSTVVLPDNSVVEITEGALSYPEAFAEDERRVNLDGSGYFEIAENPQVPFVVESPLLTVRVTGTQFMISSDRMHETATVSLVKGSVDVIIDGREPIALTEGTEVFYQAASGEVRVETMPEQVADRQALTRGTLVFENNTLEEIIFAAARSRGYAVEVRRSGLGAKRYDVKFKEGEDIEEIFGVLNILTDSGFAYIIEQNKILIE